jgi:ribonuclease D
MLVETHAAPTWINKPAQLKQLAERLSACSILAIDTESNGLHAYREQVCLIQFSDGENDYLIDPLAIKDITPLGPIFASPTIEKVFHACEYDVLCLKRDFGFSFANIFDTMVASRILGYTAVGLGSILESVFGLKLDKKYQQANWGIRPLPAEMLEYAHHDVHYLIPLRDHLKTQLAEAERLPLALEDFNRLCQVQSRQEAFNSTDMVWRVAGQQELTPTQAATLKVLIEMREDIARQRNIPSYKVLSNQHLVDVVLHAPTTLDELAENCKVPHSLMERYGNRLVDAVKRGLETSPIRRPARHRPDPSYMDRLETLRTWRKTTAQALKVESDVVLPRDIMEIIAAQNPGNSDQLQNIMAEIPWRYNVYARPILDTLNPPAE